MLSVEVKRCCTAKYVQGNLYLRKKQHQLKYTSKAEAATATHAPPPLTARRHSLALH